MNLIQSSSGSFILLTYNYKPSIKAQIAKVTPNASGKNWFRSIKSPFLIRRWKTPKIGRATAPTIAPR